MESTATIATSRKEIADAIRACVPNKVLEIDPLFIDFAEAGFKADFEPQFQIMDAEGERAIRDLRGEVICAVPPGLNSGELLLHLAHTVNDGSASLRYAPMHELNPEGIAEALKCPQEISPWFLTSIAARRMTEKLLGSRLIPKLREQGLAYPGWQSLFYLQLLRDIATPSWKRHLHFGTCVAVEIDPFGGTIFHRRYPKHLAGVFEVVQTEVQAQQPNPRFAANQLLRDTNQDLAQCQQELEQAYYSGVCSWPFPYGGLSYGERPIQVRSQPTGLLRHLPSPKPARKVIRLYRQNRILFRSLSYYSDGRALLNSLPAKAQVKVTIDPQLPCTTLEAFLDRLEAYELNLDFPPLLKLIGSDYAQSTDGNLMITPKGQALLHQIDQVGMTGRCLYSILRLLENIQTNEASYTEVLTLIKQNFHDKSQTDQKDTP
jgi:hypothetical protein